MAARLMRRRVEPDRADPAGTVLRLAVMLQAGVGPARSWEMLAAAGDIAAVRVMAAVADGGDLATAIASSMRLRWTAGSMPSISASVGSEPGPTPMMTRPRVRWSSSTIRFATM